MVETLFFVADAYRYKESGNWEYRLVGKYDSLDAAKQAYHARLGSIIKATNDFVMVILYDNFGNTISKDFVDSSETPEPEPEPEPEEE